MQLFDENKHRTCCCNEALKKGIFTKTMSNNSFCVYGNLMQGKNILLNYSGKLTNNVINIAKDKKDAPNVYLYYCFDNNWDDKKIINMSVCNQNGNLSYCMIIENIPEASYINFAFTDDNDNWDTDSHGTYCLKIYEDVEKSIMKRYGLDSTPPTITLGKLPNTNKRLVSKIKEKIVNILSIFTINKST